MATRPASFRPRSQPARIDMRREYDAKRRRTKPWRALYKTPEWQAIRVSVLTDEPLCRRCSGRGLVTAATVVNHVERHHGDPVKFFGGPFEPLCKPCHDGEVQAQEREEDAFRRLNPSEG
ncbi:HNH endonuclease [Aureimonas sp. SK2]|uniref:HNH endonuclease n=1 Tax=Aureimonas sp. SK2 TaxID=3015992 RepID=UPI002444FF56|nr:HNH endonuclease [Aureimonas sp. SK2]